MKRLIRVLIVVALGIAVLGLAAPYLPADGLRPRIESALEAALNRKVHIEKSVGLSLFTGPGFTVEKVLIADDPAVGVEPFAYVDSMRARIRISSLLAGKLAFSSLRLDGPSVNLVKLPSGPWNIQPLLDRPVKRGVHHHTVPDIQIRDGRLNFKFGDTKSVFYISSADVDVYPNENGDVVIRFSGSPARTDRGTQAFGQLSARGLLRSGADGEDRINMGLRLERTAIAEMLRLFNGRDVGVHGFATANATLAGPLSHIDITGDLNINDIHRWDLMPARDDGWTLNYAGLLDLGSHRLDLETVAAQSGPPPPVSIKFLLADYLSAPAWSAAATFRDLPAASLVETARHMGAPFPEGVQVEGKMEGGIGYGSQGGLQGELSLQDASVKFPRGASVRFDSARLLVDGNRIAFGPSGVQLDNGQSAQIEAAYSLDNSYAQLKINTRQLTIAEAESSAENVIAATPIPLLEKLRQGTWKGWIAFERREDRAGVWSGEYDLQNAVMDIPGLASPVRFASASVVMQAGVIQMSRIRARAGAVNLEGDYRYDPASARRHRVRINIPKLDLTQAETLLMPALQRDQGFLARTFRLRKETLPAWLATRQLEGSLKVGALSCNQAPMGAFTARLVWSGPDILLSDIQGQLGEMRAEGKMSLNVAGSAPSYLLSGTIENLDYRSGQLDVNGELETSGIAQNLLLNMRSQGAFEGRDLNLGPDALIREITGNYRIAPAAGIPRLALSDLQVAQGLDIFTGQGSSQPDGRIVLELTTGRKQTRLTGMLLPVHGDSTVR